MSYFLFLGVFLLVPLAVIALIVRQRLTLWIGATIAILCVLALAYTTPWDNVIIVNGIWSYGPGRISGILIGHVPLEECMFYILQVCLSGLVAFAALVRRSDRA